MKKMKTLDEVIKALRCTDPEVDPETKCNDCPYKEFRMSDLWYVGPSCLDVMFADARHYLWEFRTEQNILRDRKEHYEYWEHKYYAELEKNDPLSWDELRQMDEKPVWATFDNENGTWYVAKVYDDEVVLYEWGQEFGERISGTWDYTPKRWQAYRKERE